MTRTTKPQTAWAVISRQGYIHLDTVKRTRTEAIAEFCTGSMSKPWEWWKRKFGLRAIRIQVTAMESE